MTEERDLQWALNLAIDYMNTQYNPPTMGNSDELRQAAQMLREGGPVLEKNLPGRKIRKCKKCGTLNGWNFTWCGCGCLIANYHYVVSADVHWTERQKIKIVTERSEASFEEVDDE